MRNPIEIFLIIISIVQLLRLDFAPSVCCFSRKRKMPVWLEQLGKALPPLIMAVLIVYCLRDITTDQSILESRRWQARVNNYNKL